MVTSGHLFARFMPEADRTAKECPQSAFAGRKASDPAMNPAFRNSFYAENVIAVMIGLWLVQLWSAEKQAASKANSFSINSKNGTGLLRAISWQLITG